MVKVIIGIVVAYYILNLLFSKFLSSSSKEGVNSSGVKYKDAEFEDVD